MTTPIIGTKGAQLDLLIRQGATCGPNFMRIKDALGTYMNITGWVITGQLRKTADAVAGLATVTVTVLDAPNGSVKWEFSADATSELDADPVDETAADSQYVWDMEMLETATGRVIPLLYGNASVFREVTKA